MSKRAGGYFKITAIQLRSRIFSGSTLTAAGRSAYLVDDRLKDKITAAYLRTWRYAILLPVLIGVIIGIPVVKMFPLLENGYDLLVYAAFGGVWGLVAMAFYTAKVRAMLKDAPRTNATISRAEQQRTMLDAMPTWRAAVFLAISLAFTALALLPATSIGMPLAHRIVLVVMFGLSTLYCGAVLVAKLVRTPRAR